MQLDKATIEKLAAHLESAELEARDVLKITDDYPDMDWDDAYTIQDTIRKALADELLFGRLIDGGRLNVDLDEKDEVLLDIQPLPKKEGRSTKSEPAEPEEEATTD